MESNMKNGQLGFFDKITAVGRIGAKRAELYGKLGVKTIGDLLTLYPRDYIDYTSPVAIFQTVLNENNIISAVVAKKLNPARIRRGMTIFKAVVTDGSDDITITIYNSEYLFNSLIEGEEYFFCGKVSGNMVRREMSSPLILRADITDKIQPVYPLTEGLSQGMLRLSVKEALSRLNDFEDVLPREIQQENGICAARFAYENIHFPKDSHALVVARQRLVFEELFLLALGMQTLKNRSRENTGCKLSKASLEPFYKSLPFELTAAQKRSISECTEDMQREYPMNRLLQGDVGSGKTAVAAACSFFAAANGFQTALMAPTEILAAQHYKTLTEFLEPLGVKVCLLTGSLTQKQKNDIREGLGSGEYSVAVGTHALFQNSVNFKKLGLVITDEQHRFGVNQRAMLAGKGENPHRLVMSATPIPRTLALMIFGDLDISLLDELPKGRVPIETYAVTGKIRDRAFGFVRKQLDEGRQAYIVCPLIDESEMQLLSVVKYSETISVGAFKDYRVGLLHGKMSPADKDAVMDKFKAHELDILVSTTVIEVGVDVPNASVMVVENSDRFGLSQLHQLRGRVGRGKWQSYCILITDNPTPECRARLKILASTSDGFKISEEDLKLRGPGEFFGSRQHGLPKLKIADMGDDMEVMRLAQREAAEWSKRDPMLESRESVGLKEAVEELFSKGSDL